MIKEILELLFVSIIFIGIMGLAYWVSKKVGSYNKETGFHRNMKIVEVLPLMQGQYLYIVKVGTEYHLIGCSQKGVITNLKVLDEEQLDLEEVKNRSFQEYFTHFIKRKQGTTDDNKETTDS